MNLKHKAAVAATMAALMGLAGTAQAAFEGRDATGAPSGSCTANGADKCRYFYDTTLDITILNHWNIGKGTWSASAAPGSAQALVASEGFSASGLTGWVLPTGDPGAAAGAQNQYLSIWNSVGRTFAGLSGQFYGVQNGAYWSSTVYAPAPSLMYYLHTNDVRYTQSIAFGYTPLYALAVRPGDVPTLIPEPGTGALMLLALGAVVVAVRRRPR